MSQRDAPGGQGSGNHPENRLPYLPVSRRDDQSQSSPSGRDDQSQPSPHSRDDRSPLTLQGRAGDDRAASSSSGRDDLVQLPPVMTHQGSESRQLPPVSLPPMRAPPPSYPQEPRPSNGYGTGPSSSAPSSYPGPPAGSGVLGGGPLPPHGAQQLPNGGPPGLPGYLPPLHPPHDRPGPSAYAQDRREDYYGRGGYGYGREPSYAESSHRPGPSGEMYQGQPSDPMRPSLPPPPLANGYETTEYAQQHNGYAQGAGPVAMGAQGQQQPAPRQRTSIACRYCRKRKIRCSGYQNAPGGRCVNCTRMNQECVFQPVSSSSSAAFVHVSAVPGGVPPGTPLFGAYGQPLAAPQSFNGPPPPPGQPAQQHHQPPPQYQHQQPPPHQQYGPPQPQYPPRPQQQPPPQYQQQPPYQQQPQYQQQPPPHQNQPQLPLPTYQASPREAHGPSVLPPPPHDQTHLQSPMSTPGPSNQPTSVPQPPPSAPPSSGYYQAPPARSPTDPYSPFSEPGSLSGRRRRRESDEGHEPRPPPGSAGEEDGRGRTPPSNGSSPGNQPYWTVVV